jgi:hypothetical protein
MYNMRASALERQRQDEARRDGLQQFVKQSNAIGAANRQ